MQAFELCLPTKIVFGEGRLKELGQIVKKIGKKAFVITYDKLLMDQLGIMSKALESLAASGVEAIPFYGVKSNPSVNLIREAIEIVKVERPDVIIAIGGGSVIDSAKSIGVGACYEGDVWDFPEGKATITKSIPVVAVVTIPATSSEMNPIAVISNDTLKRKEGFGDPVMYPKVALLDPELTYSIPLQQTAYSATDIISHLLESYISHTDSFVPMQNRFCEGMIRSIIECMDILLDNPEDKQARAMFMWIATYSWNGFYPSGLGGTDAMIHVLGHSLSAFYDTPHGAAMGITIPATFKYTLDDRISRYSMFAREVFDILEADDRLAAEKGIQSLTEWIEKIGVPTTMTNGKIPTDGLDALAEDAFITAQNWGLEDVYSVEKCKELFKLCM